MATARSIGQAWTVDGPASAMTYWQIGIGCRPAKRGEGDPQWRRWRFWVWVSWATRWRGTSKTKVDTRGQSPTEQQRRQRNGASNMAAGLGQAPKLLPRARIL